MSRINDKDRLMIEKHLDRTLNYEEQTVFTQRLNDPEFATEVKLYENALKAIYALGDDHLKSMLIEEEAKLPVAAPDYPPLKKVWTMSRLAVAASLLLLIGAGVCFWGKSKMQNRSMDMVFEANFKPYPNYDTPTVRDNVSSKNNREKAYSLYDNKHYSQSLLYFEKIDTPQYKDQFYEANAYLATHQAEKAALLFEKLSKISVFDWQKQSEWYLALSLLSSKPNEAKQLLEKIKMDSAHPYQQKAADILKE